MDYDTTQVDIERAQRLAQLLRSQASNTPQGKMVGRFYVASNPLQHIANLVAEYGANKKEQEATQLSKEYAAGQSADFEKTLGAMPQPRVLTRSVPVDVAKTAPQAVQGAMPLDKSTVNAQTSVVPVETITEKQTPTRQDMLQWAGQLYKIPMARQLAAKLMADYTGQPKYSALGHMGALNQDTGEMIPFPEGMQVEQSKLLLAYQAEKQKSEDRNASLEERALARERADQIRMEIANMNAGLRRESNATNRMLAEARIEKLQAETEAKKHGTLKAPPKYMDETVQGVASEFEALTNQLKTFEDEFAGMGALGGARRGVAEIIGSWGTEKQQKMAQWWKMQDRLDELPKRLEMFGATLTGNEKQSWQAATIRPNMSPEKIKEMLNIRKSIIAKKAQELYNKWKKEGKFETSGARDYFEHYGIPMPADDAPAASGVAPAPAAPGGRNLSGATVRKVNK